MFSHHETIKPTVLHQRHIKFIWLPLSSHVKAWLRKAHKSFSAIKGCTQQNEISWFCMYVQSSMKTDNYIIIWILYVCILYQNIYSICLQIRHQTTYVSPLCDVMLTRPEKKFFLMKESTLGYNAWNLYVLGYMTHRSFPKEKSSV